MTKIHYSIIAIIAVSLAAYLIGSLYAKEEAPEPIVEPPTPIIIKVDNIDCHIAEMPTITYYVATDTARVTIECDSDLLFNYLPAVKSEFN
jgi:hypothetical protein